MKHLLIIILCLLCCNTIAAQDEPYRNVYDKAEQNYNIGRLEEAQQLLKEHIGDFSPSLQISAYRILSLSALALDQNDEAEKYARLLLDQSPYYSTTLSDPQRFIDIVENIKAGRMATITTASSHAETLNEVPVPTTLITEQMIHDSGARNLQELLATYVPGMNIIDCNDDINIAMRGVYSNGQEKILIMLNGHRLNSYATNIAAPDFSISLDKVRQIEVLRGPASSLYGGVALTAVVNVITKQGIDIDGMQAKAGAGNYGQLQASLLYGKRYFDLDIITWAALYKASGQKYYISSDQTGTHLYQGDITVGAIGPKPSYDIGAQINYKKLNILYNTQTSQVASPFTYTYTFAPYTPDKYRTYGGIRPSFATSSNHIRINTQLPSLLSPHTSHPSTLTSQFTFFYDNSDITHYQVVCEPEIYSTIVVLPIPESTKQLLAGHQGISRYLNAQEHDVGAKIQADWNITHSHHTSQLSPHTTTITLGAEYIHFMLDDCRFNYGYDFTRMLPENDTIAALGKGHENSLNSFLQLKHQYHNFILNSGLRFDYKWRYNQTNIHELSPRVALIWLQPKWNLKLSYSKAFIDAPYMYRKTNLFLYTFLLSSAQRPGGASSAADISTITPDNVLQPETLHSLQLTFTHNNLTPKSSMVNGQSSIFNLQSLEVNAFFNKARNLIHFLLTDHYNTGISDTYGIELTARMSALRSKLTADINATYQNTTHYEIFNYDINRQLNTPAFTTNAVITYQPFKNNFKLRSNIHFQTSQRSFYIDLIEYTSVMTLTDILTSSLVELQELQDMPDSDPIKIKELENSIELIDKALDEASSKMAVFPSVPQRLLFDLGATYTWKNLTFDIDVKNLLNHKYRQGGMSTTLIPQRGRWFMGSITYKF